MQSMFEALSYALKESELREVGLRSQGPASYLRAIRQEGSHTFGHPVGRATHIVDQREQERIIAAAERDGRPYAIVQSDLSGKEYILLFDTNT